MSRYLINGSDMLARRPGFKLIGRKEEFTDLCCVLTQSTANSVIASGPGGVGVSAMALNLQACKSDPNAPFDIVSKRLSWLDTDSLFGLGNNASIDVEFKSIFGILRRTPGSILIVEDTIDLIEALRNCGMMHVINALNSLVRANQTQAYLEVREKDLAEVYKTHSDFREHYTLFDVKEPTGDELYKIVGALSKNLQDAYSISIAETAVRASVDLSNRYRSVDTGLNCAQPERSRLLLDRAMSKYALRSHSTVPRVTELEAELKTLSSTDRRSLQLTREIEAETAAFVERQALIRKYFLAQREGERSIIVLEEEIKELVDKEKERSAESKNDPKKFDFDVFSPFAEATGYSTPDIEDKRKKIEELNKGVKENLVEYKKVTDEINAKMCLTEDAVISEFSRISGIDESKLRQDDVVKLVNLGKVLKSRVFGQDDALEYVYRRIKIWKRGRRTNRPLPFMFCGPSGIGKTEICRALAEGLFDTEHALNKFDMGDYGEKNDVTKLIGAPPGYEGFDVGGEMTTSIRSNPYQVMLMDEVEKAHPAIFNTFLSILDSGYCKDNLGRRCEFGDTIMPFTTNIGQEAMLHVGRGAGDMSEDAAYDQTIKELETFFKPEFLNRLEGRENIIVLKRLELDVIRRIANRELSKIQEFYAPNISVEFPQEDLNAFCAKVYTPKVGARGIPGKIKTVEGFIVDKQLEDETFLGSARVKFESTSELLSVLWEDGA